MLLKSHRYRVAPAILAGYINDANADYFAKAIKGKFTTNESSRNIKIVSARVKEQALIEGVTAAVPQKKFET